MLITIANQKGGVGKSTIALLFANWLKEQDNDVVILDADRQATIYYQRESDKKNFSEQEFRYKISQFDIDKTQKDISVILTELKTSKPETFVIIDAPGNLSENGLVPCLALADLIICPFQYERKALDSTGTFIVVLKRVLDAYKTSPKTIFLPNRVKTNTGTKEEKETYRQVEEVFLQYGSVAPFIKELQAVNRVNSFSLTKEQYNEVNTTFTHILSICKN